MDTTTAFIMNTRDRAVAEVERRNQIISSLHQEVYDLKVIVNKLKSELNSTKEELAVESAYAAGLFAQITFIKQLKEKSAFAYQASNKFFKDGSPKSNMVVVYEAAFDAKARELGIMNPTDYRED